jgi:hypothetical protein
LLDFEEEETADHGSDNQEENDNSHDPA